jgi:hypothetical protein
MIINNIKQVTYSTISNDLIELITLESFKDCEYTYEVELCNDEFIVNSTHAIANIIKEYFNSHNIDTIPFDNYTIYVCIDRGFVHVEICS